MQVCVCVVAVLLAYIPTLCTAFPPYYQRPRNTPCQSKKLTTSHGHVTSPNYPDHYPPSVYCTTEIQGPPYTTIAITFTEFSLEKSCTNCCDYVELIDKHSTTTNRKLCGSDPMPTGAITLDGGGNNLKVVFHSDHSYQYRGFRANYSFQTYEPHIDCYLRSKDESYIGAVNITRSGIACQRWDVQHPHAHDFTPADFPANGYTSNHCRVLDEFVTWCYTVQQTPRWEICDVPECGTLTTMKTTTITSTPSTEPTTKPTQTMMTTNPPPAHLVKSTPTPKQTQPSQSLVQTNSSQQSHNPKSESSHPHLGAILGGTVVMLVGVVVGVCVCVLVRRRRRLNSVPKYVDRLVDGEESTEEGADPESSSL